MRKPSCVEVIFWRNQSFYVRRVRVVGVFCCNCCWLQNVGVVFCCCCCCLFCCCLCVMLLLVFCVFLLLLLLLLFLFFICGFFLSFIIIIYFCEFLLLLVYIFAAVAGRVGYCLGFLFSYFVLIIFFKLPSINQVERCKTSSSYSIFLSSLFINYYCIIDIYCHSLRLTMCTCPGQRDLTIFKENQARYVVNYHIKIRAVL